MLSGRAVISPLRFGIGCFVALPSFQSPSLSFSPRVQSCERSVVVGLSVGRSFATVKDKKTVILSSQELRKVIPGGKTIFSNLNLNLELGKKIGIVGINGTGKSTLIKTLGGFDKEFEGQLVKSHGIEIGYLPQEPELDDSKTVLENVYDGVSEKLKMLDRMSQLKSLLEREEDSELVAEKVQLDKQLREEGLYSLKSEVQEVMEALGCPPPHSKVTHLSGGEKRRVALSRLLISKPDLLLLDEPTNHIDQHTVNWLQTYLSKFEGSLLLITHDKTFLNNVTNEILELDRGSCYFHKGKYNDWLLSKDQRNEQNKLKLKEMEKFINLQSSKLSKANTKAREAQLEKAKQEKEMIVEAKKVLPFSFPNVFVNDKNHIRVDKLGRKKCGEYLFRNLTFQMKPGDIIGVIGPNGAGKTTLLRTILNHEAPCEGIVEVSRESSLNYLEQTRHGLDPTTNVFDTVTDGDRRICNSYLTKFNLKGSMQTQMVSTLSGGERNRVHLAKMIKDPATFLLLDEPTNDLDKEVVANLETAIREFNGGIMIASHDIPFLSRVCNAVLSIDPSTGKTHFFRGTIEEYKKALPWPKPKRTVMKMPVLTKKTPVKSVSPTPSVNNITKEGRMNF